MKQPFATFCLSVLLLACVPASGPAPHAGSTVGGLALDTITAEPLDLAAPQTTEIAPPPPASPPIPESTPIPATAMMSPQQADCLEKGNLWSRVGESIVYACVRLTRDGGKQCSKGTDCEGVCLARSMTCAPYDPLFGCNEILQDDGSRTTLCLN